MTMSKKFLDAGVGIILIVVLFFFFIHFSPNVQTSERNEFIQENLLSGGPPKDGIPSLETDQFEYGSADSVDLRDEDIIFGINYNGLVAAYPLNIMVWHEVVNEEVQGEKISVTYCPLTQTVIGYKGYNLGVSGLLFNGNLVVYDRKTDALMPQIEGNFIDKSIEDVEPEFFPVVVTNWGSWKGKYPNTKVMVNPRHNRNYNVNPYDDYYAVDDVFFPLEKEDDVLSRKDMVFGVAYQGESVAVPIETFRLKYPNGLTVSLGEETVKLFWDESLSRIQTDRPDINGFDAFWFAWYAFHPETNLILN